MAPCGIHCFYLLTPEKSLENNNNLEILFYELHRVSVFHKSFSYSSEELCFVSVHQWNSLKSRFLYLSSMKEYFVLYLQYIFCIEYLSRKQTSV